MNRIARTLATTLASSTAVLAASMIAAPHADAAATNCVTKAEFKAVKLGMTKKKAQSIMGATPYESFVHPAYAGKFFNYKACTEDGYVQLRVKDTKVKFKAADWTYDFTPPEPPPCPTSTARVASTDDPPPPPDCDGDGGGQVPW